MEFLLKNLKKEIKRLNSGLVKYEVVEYKPYEKIHLMRLNHNIKKLKNKYEAPTVIEFIIYIEEGYIDKLIKWSFGTASKKDTTYAYREHDYYDWDCLCDLAEHLETQAIWMQNEKYVEVLEEGENDE